jgi:hypothetical protein
MRKITSTGRLMDYREFRGFGDLFVETGSGHGDGIQRALDAGFPFVSSVEAQPDNFRICQARFETNLNVSVYFGKSVNVLPVVLNPLMLKVYGGKCVIFLDAHVSGEKSAGYSEWLSGNPEATQDYIIRHELEIVLGMCKGAPIIMDDINGEADGFAQEYADIISRSGVEYEFFFFDENLSGSMLYKDKLLVAIPK